MRTPKETLERLAGVAPEEWGLTLETMKDGNNRDVPALCLHPGARWFVSSEGDVGTNSFFTAFLKKKLVEMGCMIGTEVSKDGVEGRLYMGQEEVWYCHAKDCQTEWQAVAECVIGVLEND
jgi:hypothetical protein